MNKNFLHTLLDSLQPVKGSNVLELSEDGITEGIAVWDSSYEYLGRIMSIEGEFYFYRKDEGFWNLGRGMQGPRCVIEFLATQEGRNFIQGKSSGDLGKYDTFLQAFGFVEEGKAKFIELV